MANYNLREVLKQLGRNILSWVKSNCVNNCVSTTTNLPLAAAQGKVLQDQITALNSNITQHTAGEFILPDGLKMCWGTVNNASFVKFPFEFTKKPIFFAQQINTNVNISMSTHVVDITTSTANTVTYYVDASGNKIIYQTGTFLWLAIGY